ncbi:alkaline phosphatase, partial [Rhizobium leguminosarum]
QPLPSGISPEGAIALPARNLFATATEVDLGKDGGTRSHVMLYERSDGETSSPPLFSSSPSFPPLFFSSLSFLSSFP